MFLKLRKNIILSLTKKELGYYFNNPFGYIAATLFGIFASFVFVKDIFLVGDGSMRQFFEILVWLLLIFVPTVAMRLFSEEKRLKTLELLLSFPVTIEEIVLAKFLSLIVFCFIAVTLTFSIPVSLFFISSPPVSTIIVSYLGVFMFIGFLGSVSLFFSSRTTSQIVALLSSVLVSFVFLVFGSDFFGSFLPLSLKNILVFMSPLNYLDFFYKGIIDLRSVIFFLTFILVFLVSSYLSIRKNRS
ncbi:hypothetical protein A2690_00545 [Candidatus Roizmanbacteria bacterium RIFCSPHIGHO2_01_FULL_39_12b]|uniref:ABC-2 type transporter domain-containing protein n=1 Tax=Candidatus Roizmanbacteria bacterium RIFCSPHIGHO2_01_FULL_39_12b TaxID=1802030 RepID=A0A1F7G8S9_9BACT|nr:MAG: hypothetical protein A2690_00545 [Candidatus Roizmanbacteria bacterium RIFCSPHIGHO2_01_FULL_39_12b]OGK46049.1 MAG: hypothetical protein A3B46_00835 [Candidatus Roizmanbacteria bacterium RIFCSPLOWO2_01_FULL_39_19]